MTQLYDQKTWASEVILDADMNRMEYGIAGRSYHVFAGGTKGDFDDLQEAIDKCESDGGGTVVVHGEIVAQSKLTIQESNIALIGRDYGSIKKKTDLNDTLLEIGVTGSTKENILVSGLLINGNKANQSGAARDIYVRRGTNIRIEKNKIFDGKWHALYFDNYAQNKIWVQGNYFLDIDTVGIFFDGLAASSGDINFIENILENIGDKGINFTSNAIRVNISKNQLSAITLGGIVITADVSLLHLCGNIMNDIGAEGILLYGPSGFTVVGNVINDVVTLFMNLRGIANGVIGDNEMLLSGTNGIYGSDLAQLLIKGNHLTNTDEHGMLFDTSYDQNDRCHIEGNLLTAVGQVLTNSYDGINANMRNSGITGNHIANPVGNMQRYGINEAGTKNHVNSNSDHGAATAGFNITGTGSQSGGNTSTV